MLPSKAANEYQQTEAAWMRLRLSAGIFVAKGRKTWEA